MGFLRASQNPAYVPRITGLQVQTSSSAVPIPLVYGRNKLAPNVIWSGKFYAIPQKQNSGKGGGGPITGYTYFSSFLLAVAEGPINNYHFSFLNQQITWGLQATGLEVSTGGSTPQAPWGYLSALYPGQALGYNGVAYVGAFNYNLGSSATLPQFSFAIDGIAGIRSGNVVNGADSDPALIIQDFLTNAQYGVLFPAASIDAATLLGSSGDSSYQTYCRASYLALSPVLTNQEAANSILARWLQLTNTAAVWSGGKLKFIPYGDTSVSQGVGTFNPNVTPVYNLADDDFVHEDGKDPFQVVRSDPYASYNWQRLQINLASSFYDAMPIDVWDQNAIELYGLRMASDITATEITDPGVASISAQLILQRGLYILNTYTFKLSFEYCLLEPMDLVTVTDAGLGLSNTAIRVTAIEEDDAGLLSVTAEEFPGGTATAVQYPVQLKMPNPTNQAVVPARVNPPVIYEPPSALNGGVAQVWAAVSGGVASAYFLAEDNSNGQHFAQMPLPSRTSGMTIAFSAYVQASASRTAFRLDVYNGSAVIGCDFNLAAGTAGTPDTGITIATITPAGGGWFQVSIAAVMAAAAQPIVYLVLENPYGTQVYTGTSGDGIYIWGAQFGWTDPAAGTVQAPAFLPLFASLTGATYAANAIATPEGAAGVADPNWGGAFVWISADNATYGQIGTVQAPSRQGVLTAAMGAADTSLSVTLEESGGQLLSGTALDAQNGITLCLVDQELLAYQTATLLSAPPPNAYTLSGLVRGFYGTAAAAHSNGAPFTRLDSAIFKFNLPAAYIGVPLYMKFQSFNIFGLSVQDLSECAVYTYTPSGAGSTSGPVTQALAAGTSMDFRLASEVVSETDQWGIVADGFVLAQIDLGAGIP